MSPLGFAWLDLAGRFFGYAFRKMTTSSVQTEATSEPKRKRTKSGNYAGVLCKRTSRNETDHHSGHRTSQRRQP